MIWNFKKVIRNSRITELAWSIRALWGDTPEIVSERYYKPRTRYIIDNYIKQQNVRKLHIGAQSNVLNDWLNVDIYTSDQDNVAYMNAVKPFPLPDSSFDYVFSEHMIEHVRIEDAYIMIKECSRILKPGGKIRIATPGLDKILGLSKEDENAKAYFNEIVKPSYPAEINIPFRVEYLVNYITYNYGHRFIYTKQSLADLLESCGFKVINFYAPHTSDDMIFKSVEGHGKNSNLLCDIETINVEAIRQ